MGKARMDCSEAILIIFPHPFSCMAGISNRAKKKRRRQIDGDCFVPGSFTDFIPGFAQINPGSVYQDIRGTEKRRRLLHYPRQCIESAHIAGHMGCFSARLLHLCDGFLKRILFLFQCRMNDGCAGRMPGPKQWPGQCRNSPLSPGPPGQSAQKVRLSYSF